MRSMRRQVGVVVVVVVVVVYSKGTSLILCGRGQTLNRPGVRNKHAASS